jgi:hypothetical protein
MGKEKKEKKHKHKHGKDKKEKKRHGSSKKDKSSKKRKRDDSSSSGSESSSGSSRQHQPSSVPAAAVAAPPSRMPLGLSYDDLFPIPTKRKVTGASSSISSFSVTTSEMQQRANRAERFVESAADAALREHRAKSLAHASTAGGALRGQSVQLEKSYTRLTALPNAADVRPLPVLRQVRVSVRVRSRDSR